MKRSSMLGSARRLGARMLAELRESTEPFVMRQLAFAGKTTVGECVQAMLACPPCNAADQGERFTLGTGVPPCASCQSTACVQVCVRVLAGWELYRKLVLQRHPTHVLHPRVTVLIVKALKHEATCTSANSHPTSVEGALHIGKVRTACSAYCGKGAPALMLVRCSSRWPWRRSS